MKTFKIAAHDPAVLHNALAAGGVPVVSVRSSFLLDMKKSAMYGVVVCEDGAVDAQVSSIIAAHVAKAPTASRPAKEVSDAQDLMVSLK